MDKTFYYGWTGENQKIKFSLTAVWLWVEGGTKKLMNKVRTYDVHITYGKSRMYGSVRGLIIFALPFPIFYF